MKTKNHVIVRGVIIAIAKLVSVEVDAVLHVQTGGAENVVIAATVAIIPFVTTVMVNVLGVILLYVRTVFLLAYRVNNICVIHVVRRVVVIVEIKRAKSAWSHVSVVKIIIAKVVLTKNVANVQRTSVMNAKHLATIVVIICVKHVLMNTLVYSRKLTMQVDIIKPTTTFESSN